MINLESILDKGRINFRRHSRVIFERIYFFLRQLGPCAKKGNLLRSFEGCFSFPSANINSKISLFAADGFLEGGGENGRQSRSVPVKSEHRSERLKPDRIGNPLHKFI